MTHAKKPVFREGDHLSLGLLLRRFWGRITITWTLVFAETGMFALLPLVIGWSIDGLLQGDLFWFQRLLMLFGGLLVISISRRVYDTRAYGSVRAELGRAQAERNADLPISRKNARILMGRELVDFLEKEAPESMTALVKVVAAVAILFSFAPVLALSAGGAGVLMLVLFGFATGRFFRLNGALNEQAEAQITALESRDVKRVAAHFFGLRRREVELSDWESLVYGVIFAVLLAMLSYNLYFAATTLGASPGAIFSIVTYSFEFVESAVILPYAMQSLTRLKEITARINKSE